MKKYYLLLLILLVSAPLVTAFSPDTMVWNDANNRTGTYYGNLKFYNYGLNTTPYANWTFLTTAYQPDTILNYKWYPTSSNSLGDYNYYIDATNWKRFPTYDTIITTRDSGELLVNITKLYVNDTHANITFTMGSKSYSRIEQHTADNYSIGIEWGENGTSLWVYNSSLWIENTTVVNSSVIANYTFSTDREGWSEDGWLWKDGFLFANGSSKNTWSPITNISNYTFLTHTLNMQTANISTLKMFLGSQSQYNLTGIRYYLEETDGTHIVFKHEGGSYNSAMNSTGGVVQIPFDDNITIIINVDLLNNITNATITTSEGLSGTVANEVINTTIDDYLALTTTTYTAGEARLYSWDIQSGEPVEINYTAPVITNLEIRPTSPYDYNNLLLYATTTEYNGLDINYSVEWYKNGNSYLNLTTGDFSQSSESLIATLTSGNTTKDDIFYAKVIANGLYNSSTASYSNNVTILEYIPMNIYNLTSSISSGNLNDSIVWSVIVEPTTSSTYELSPAPLNSTASYGSTGLTYQEFFDEIIADGISSGRYVKLIDIGAGRQALVIPDYTASNECTDGFLKNSSGLAKSFDTDFEFRGDKHTEIGIVLSMYSNESLFDAWYNGMEHENVSSYISQTTTPVDCLTVDRMMYVDGKLQRFGNGDSATDVSRKAQAYFYASGNPSFSQENRTKYLERALCTVNASNTYEIRTYESGLNTPYGTITHLPFGGTNAAYWGITAEAHHMWVGYFDDVIRNNMLAYMVTNNEYYLEYAEDAAKVFLTIEMQNTSIGFGTNVYLGRYENSSGNLVWRCHSDQIGNECEVGNNQWDRSDRPRGQWACQAPFLYEKKTGTLSGVWQNLSDFCDAGLNESAKLNPIDTHGMWNVRYNGTVSDVSSEGYFNAVTYGMLYNTYYDLLDEKALAIFDNYQRAQNSWSWDSNQCRNVFSFEGAHSAQVIGHSLGYDQLFLQESGAGSYAVSEVYFNMTLPNGTIKEIGYTSIAGSTYSLTCDSTSLSCPTTSLGNYTINSVRAVNTQNETYTNTSLTSTVELLNTAPNITYVNILPSTTAYTNTDLSANVSGNDFEGDTLTYQYLWYENDVLIGGETNSTLSSSNFVKGDIIILSSRVFDGTDYSNYLNSTSKTIANSIPTASVVDITPNFPTTTDLLVGSYTFTDLDSDTDSSTFKWFKNGVVVAGQTTSNLSSSNFVKGDVIIFQVTPNDGVVAGTSVNSSSVTILNTVPTATNLNITPTTAYTYDNLLGSYTFVDPDNDGDESTYAWYKNDILIAGQTGTTLLSSNFVKGDSIIFQIRPFDGSVFGSRINSSAIIINNSIPTISYIELSPSSPTSSDNITLNYTYYDYDNDNNQSTVTWLVNDIIVAYNITILTSGNFTDSDNVSVQITPYDGTAYGIMQSANVQIGNTAPVVSNISIVQTTAYTNTTLTGTYDYYDADLDPDNSQFVWLKNGFVISGQNTTSLSGTNFVKGDNITFRVIAYDGKSTGNTITSSPITIQNTAPVVSNINITNINIYTDTIINYNYTFYDEDSDGNNSVIRWYVNSILVSTNSSLDTSLFVKGDSIIIEVTAYDGQAYGNSINSTTRTVLNSVPIISDLIILPTTAYTTSSLNASYTFTDADNDNDFSTFRWYKNETLIYTGSILNSSYFTKDENITLIITPNDGTDDGTLINASIQITNSNPLLDIENISIPSTSIVDTIVLIANATDSDNDNITYSIVQDELGRLVINDTTGIVLLNETLDNTLVGNYTIIISATDSTTTTNSTFVLTVTYVAPIVVGGGGGGGAITTDPLTNLTDTTDTLYPSITEDNIVNTIIRITKSPLEYPLLSTIIFLSALLVISVIYNNFMGRRRRK